MDIDNLTIKHARELARLFGAAEASLEPAFTPHIGKRCVVRTYASGVFFGEVVKQSGRMVELRNARRLWTWKAAESISLSAVAVDGVEPARCRFPQVTPEHTILDALEIIPASAKAAATIDATPVTEQR